MSYSGIKITSSNKTKSGVINASTQQKLDDAKNILIGVNTALKGNSKPDNASIQKLSGYLEQATELTRGNKEITNSINNALNALSASAVKGVADIINELEKASKKIDNKSASLKLAEQKNAVLSKELLERITSLANSATAGLTTTADANKDSVRFTASAGISDTKPSKKFDVIIKDFASGIGNLESGKVLVTGGGSGGGLGTDKKGDYGALAEQSSIPHDGTMAVVGKYTGNDALSKATELAGTFKPDVAYDLVPCSGSGTVMLPAAIMATLKGINISSYTALDSCGSIPGMKNGKSNIGGSRESSGNASATVNASAGIWLASNGTDIVIINSSEPTNSSNSIKFTTTDTMKIYQTLADPESLLNSSSPIIPYVPKGQRGDAVEQVQPKIEKEDGTLTITLGGEGNVETKLTSIEEDGKIVGYEYSTELKSDAYIGPVSREFRDRISNHGTVDINENGSLTVYNTDPGEEGSATITAYTAPLTTLVKNGKEITRGVKHGELPEFYFGQ